jgi:hypothetical protein
MATDWVIARTFTDPDGVAITRYWSGGIIWRDTAVESSARFASQTRALDRYAMSLRATGRKWQGEISLVQVRPKNICPVTGKMIHPTRDHAERFLIQIWQDTRRRAQRNRRETRAYECRETGHPHWHLTSISDWEEVDLPKRVG